jgi:acyl-CoA synthetase (AMP-forming)/AMP-acid ligase II
LNPLGLEPSDRPAVIDAASGTVVSYADLIARAQATGALLGDARQLVFLFARNDLFSAVTYAGALLDRHPVALLDARTPGASAASVVRSYSPTWIAGPEGIGRQLAAETVPVERVIATEGGELVRTGFPVQVPLHPDLAVMLTTSGTTGSSKFVRLSQGNLEANAASIAGYLGLTASERAITSLPIHYSFGLSVLNSHWLAGATVVTTGESIIQKPFWEVFARYECTSLAGVPYTYQMLERVGFRDMTLPSLRTLQQAGGALDRSLAAAYGTFMADRGGRFFVMYGQTEATARIAYVPPDRLSEKPGSAGIAIPGGRLSIETAGPEPAGAETTDGLVTGEVVYEGPNVMLGYADRASDLALGDELGGVLRTGDMGYLDVDGFLFLIGRSKRIAKVFGLRVNLDEIEARLREHGPAAVVGGQDRIWAFCAFGSDATVATLAESFARDYRLHRSALLFRHVDEIPTTSSGNTDYRQVDAWTTD